MVRSSSSALMGTAVAIAMPSCTPFTNTCLTTHPHTVAHVTRLGSLATTGQQGDGGLWALYFGIEDGEVDIVDERGGDRFRGTWGGTVRHGNGFCGRGLRHLFVSWLAMLCAN